VGEFSRWLHYKRKLQHKTRTNTSHVRRASCSRRLELHITLTEFTCDKCRNWHKRIKIVFLIISAKVSYFNEPSNSVSIMSSYGLDDRAIEVRSPAEEKRYLLPLSSVSRPALGPTQPPVQWVPGVLSPGLKSGRGVTLTTHPHLVPRSRMSWNYMSSPPTRLHGV
jgi:hypothetical protein